ncbi:transglycosylase SLT domain-containing protein [Kitasatospora sp. NPDC002227]|uniref:aggregation-promoting factor C-terminal-like domain-containing protein n=1 Tax=Kitasatospora sp. NPDC002227 TaxID=3154773 RepID=UPI003318B65B
MRKSLTAAMRRRSTLVVAAAGLATACAASAVAVALPEDHAPAKVNAAAAAPAAQTPAPQAPAAPAAPAPAAPAAQAPAAPAPAAPAPAEQPQAASRSEERPALDVSDTSPSGVKALAKSIVPADQFAAFSNIISHESSWNIKATNASSGAYGLAQALPGSKMASQGSDWRTNPETQIRWALDYMNSRYGSPNAAWSFWQNHHWY